jgi:hypothetical protein
MMETSGRTVNTPTRGFSVIIAHERPFASIGANRCELVCLAWSETSRSRTFAHIRTNGSDKVIDKVFEQLSGKLPAFDRFNHRLRALDLAMALRIRNPRVAPTY